LRYGNVPGPQTDQIRQWADDYDVEQKEKLLDRYRRWNASKSGIKPEARTDSDKEAYEAAIAEEEGDRVKARELWAKVRERDDISGWGPLARRHAALLDQIGAKEAALKRYFKDPIRDRSREPDLTGQDLEAFTALRYEKFGDRWMAKQKFEAMKKDNANDTEKRFWFLFAAAKARELRKNKQSEEARDKMVHDKIAAFEKEVKAATRKKGAVRKWDVLDLVAFCMDVEKLYGEDSAFKEEVARVSELRGRIRAKYGQ
jgi:hypothetical protein